MIFFIDHSMIQTRRLKNIVILFQTILNRSFPQMRGCNDNLTITPHLRNFNVLIICLISFNV